MIRAAATIHQLRGAVRRPSPTGRGRAGRIGTFTSASERTPGLAPSSQIRTPSHGYIRVSQIFQKCPATNLTLAVDLVPLQSYGVSTQFSMSYYIKALGPTGDFPLCIVGGEVAFVHRNGTENRVPLGQLRLLVTRQRSFCRFFWTPGDVDGGNGVALYRGGLLPCRLPVQCALQ